jgi:Protein of unknown function (DUF3300)
MARMTKSSETPRRWPNRLLLSFGLAALVVAANLVVGRASAQAPSDGDAPLLSSAELGDLVGPIALYPDDLIAIVLPASTYPLQVVEAARFLDEREGNSDAKPPADWDDSVVALLNYPEVLRRMNDDLDWTWRLGEAVLNQRPAVLDAIQGFRDRAYAAGNLRSDDRQVVADDQGAITITPADPTVIYVPYYEPDRVVVYQSVPVLDYYPYGYPIYDYPYPAGYIFDSGLFWGVTTAFVIGWNTHLLHVYHHGYYAHPYYGRHYYDPWYVRRDTNLVAGRSGYVWRPSYRRAARPFVYRNGHPVAGARPPAHGDRRDGGGDHARGFAGNRERGDGDRARGSAGNRERGDHRSSDAGNRDGHGTLPGRSDNTGTQRLGFAAGGATTHTLSRTGGARAANPDTLRTIHEFRSNDAGKVRVREQPPRASSFAGTPRSTTNHNAGQPAFRSAQPTFRGTPQQSRPTFRGTPQQSRPTFRGTPQQSRPTFRGTPQRSQPAFRGTLQPGRSRSVSPQVRSGGSEHVFAGRSSGNARAHVSPSGTASAHRSSSSGSRNGSPSRHLR